MELTKNHENTVIETLLKYQARSIRVLIEEAPRTPQGALTGYWVASLLQGADEGAGPPVEAWRDLDYTEGYPTDHSTGAPFWERIAEEPVEYYNIFYSFLELGPTRDLHGLRFKLEQKPPLNPRFLKSLYDLYFWDERSRAYDNFNQAFREKFRSVQIQQTEDTHLALGQELATKCSLWLEENWKTLSERTVLDLFKMGIQLQRISLGLNAAGPGGAKAGGGAGNVSIGALQVNNNGGIPVKIMEKALNDPETADLFQQLAIKLERHEPILLRRDDSGEEVAQEVLDTKGGIR